MDRYRSEYLEDEELDLQQQGSSAHPEPELVTSHQNIVDEAELLAAQAAAEAAAAEQQQQPGNAFSNVGQGLVAEHRDLMIQYWQETIDSIENDEHDFKNHQLPLARIKKVMKTDEDVKMISAEAPILFAKGCDIFITELTMRAWIHAEENKRRTLQKSDIAAALSKSDMFDFLIDIVPREEEKPKKPNPKHMAGPLPSTKISNGNPDSGDRNTSPVSVQAPLSGVPQPQPPQPHQLQHQQSQVPERSQPPGNGNYSNFEGYGQFEDYR
ncbi:CCAAT- binding transcription factor component [Yamadazyma tenuis]|uniref:Histone-fold-containing protein n=1 Tax=Candida tenuis (strain ATCC 10573 / BCRC 21748 / CBS 615 / JCM 9827 / NBRC 10315 / NRRL Y-1498 / VKM Y-70) TaxID=590646 RepID=G3AXZ6_CANTC|nr:histone-fold-containing protein [Yamadazyma tenuis ATCC 10573]EGV65732.1 histone-fold-containing protein [Yamadazyma tenuis ATCC 10573]WEJ95951.1 CCAAT- binding transcription factor component [Yamadazyma tenuis]